MATNTYDMKNFFTNYFKINGSKSEKMDELTKLMNECARTAVLERAAEAEKKQKLDESYELLIEAFKDVLNLEGINWKNNLAWEEFLNRESLEAFIHTWSFKFVLSFFK